VHVELVEGGLEAALRELAGLKEGRRAAVLATSLEGGAHQVLYPSMGERGSDASLMESARLALRGDRSSVVETAEGPVFLGAFNPPARLVVVGAVHIAQALAPMAALAGLDVTVLDPRSAFATDARFPDVQLLRAWPEEALPGFGLDSRTAVVTLSHDPKLDDPALAAALRSEAFYVGALGSRRTHQRRLARLTDLGFSESDTARIHAPVGMDIGAVSPAEIAVATLAQVVATLRSEDRPVA
jgi:xanthine dehydrogenase accessory factor